VRHDGAARALPSVLSTAKENARRQRKENRECAKLLRQSARLFAPRPRLKIVIGPCRFHSVDSSLRVSVLAPAATGPLFFALNPLLLSAMSMVTLGKLTTRATQAFQRRTDERET